MGSGTTVAGTVLNGKAKGMNRNTSMGKSFPRLSFDVIVILFALVALLPTKKLVAVETGCVGDQIQAVQDEAAPDALTFPAADAPVSRDFVYLIPAGPTHFLESSFVSSHSLRGPPRTF